MLADSLLRLLTHPCPVGTYVSREALSVTPLTDLGLRQTWEDRRLISVLRRHLDQRTVHQYGNRIKVRRLRLKPQPEGFEGNRAAAGKGIQNRRRVTIAGGQDLSANVGQQPFVPDVLPDDEPLNHLVKTVPLSALRRLRGEPVGMGTRIVNELCEQDSAGRREWTTRPPHVERRRVTVPDRLLPSGLSVDCLQRQSHLDQLALVH